MHISKGESCLRRELLTTVLEKQTQNIHYFEQLNSFRNISLARPSKLLRCNNQRINEKLMYTPSEGEPFHIWKDQQSTGTRCFTRLYYVSFSIHM